MDELPSGLIEWLASGERGTSSDTMVTHLFGVDALGRWSGSHPHDPADLRRCREFVARVPAVGALLPLMANCSPEWGALVAHWPELCALMDSELSGSRSAPKTYARMRQLIDGAGRKEEQ